MPLILVAEDSPTQAEQLTFILERAGYRVIVDSLSALERVSTIKGFREFVIALTSFIKHQEVAGLFTSTTGELMGGTSVTEAHISTITGILSGHPVFTSPDEADRVRELFK